MEFPNERHKQVKTALANLICFHSYRVLYQSEKNMSKCHISGWELTVNIYNPIIFIYH